MFQSPVEVDVNDHFQLVNETGGLVVSSVYVFLLV